MRFKYGQDVLATDGFFTGLKGFITNYNKINDPYGLGAQTIQYLVQFGAVEHWFFEYELMEYSSSVKQGQEL